MDLRHFTLLLALQGACSIPQPVARAERADDDASDADTESDVSTRDSASGEDVSVDSIHRDGRTDDVAEACAEGLARCGTRCVDLTRDPMNCGNCSVPCASPCVCFGGCFHADGGLAGSCR